MFWKLVLLLSSRKIMKHTLLGPIDGADNRREVIHFLDMFSLTEKKRVEYAFLM
jgi:hypothetical protein